MRPTPIGAGLRVHDTFADKQYCIDTELTPGDLRSRLQAIYRRARRSRVLDVTVCIPTDPDGVPLLAFRPSGELARALARVEALFALYRGAMAAAVKSLGADPAREVTP